MVQGCRGQLRGQKKGERQQEGRSGQFVRTEERVPAQGGKGSHYEDR